jgi:SAM-dependent methyltransferase
MSAKDSQPAAIAPSTQVMQLIWPGAMAAQAIYTAAKLRIAELLVEKPRTVQDLAQVMAVDPRSLHRLLRALTSLGIFEETSTGTFRNTPQSDTLRHDVSGSTGAWVLLLGAPFNWKLWGGLEDAVRTGSPASYHVFGKSFWEHLAENPGDAAVFNGAMSAGSQMIAADTVKAYDFSIFQKIVDVGGGQGELLHAILAAAPQLRGVLYDLPEVVANARVLQSSDVAGRVEIVGGSFFDSVPPADAYMLKGIIHDWDDIDAIKVLKNCRRSIAAGGKLLISTSLLKSSNEPDRGNFMDIYMMLLGGRERTEDEFRAILADSGFSLKRVIPMSHQSVILECEPA